MNAEARTFLWRFSPEEIAAFDFGDDMTTEDKDLVCEDIGR